MARKRNRHRDTGRDGGRFVAIPCAVLDSPAYLGLSHPAKALLMEVARQYRQDDNGRMLISRAYLKPRGWTSSDVLTRAKRELLEAGLIFETVMGQRPNRASWYAVTWRMLDKIPGYDIGTERAFVRGAYRLKAGAVLRPPDGTGEASIAPLDGTRKAPAVPPDGAMRANFAPLSVPPDGDPLDVPVSGARPAGAEGEPEPAAGRVGGAVVDLDSGSKGERRKICAPLKK